MLPAVRLGNRSTRAVLRAPFQRPHYRTLAGMLIGYPDFVANLSRYLTGRGSYPYACRVRTPVGMIAPTLYSSHDIVTMSEVFCRRDYQAGRDLSVVIDIGSNIGISALYFLTRNQRSRVYCFEPDPRNVDRLRLNLAGYEDRFSVEPVAVGVQDGEVSFGTEPTGRYGRISDNYGEPILVSCRDINLVIEAVVEREGRVNILKIDAEGLEEQLVSAIRPRLLEQIATVYYETVGAAPLHLNRFEHRYDCQVNRLSRRFGL
jgi:FkbM family methyltransferase